MSVNLYESTRRHIPRDGNNHSKFPYYTNKFGQHDISECPSLAVFRRINVQAEPVAGRNLRTLSTCGRSF